MSRQILLMGSVAGLAACGIGLLLDPRAMLASYLTAWFAVAAIPIGALGVVFTAYLVRGGWTQDLHEPLTRAALLTPVAGLLFIPVLLGLSAIYPWTGSNIELPTFKALYLTPLFFVLRSVGYFAIWSALALWARHAYCERGRMERAAAIGLIMWVPTISFAGIDWIELIESKFHSSVYGLLILSFTLLAALAFGLVAILVRGRPRRMANTAYAGVLLSVLLIWAYLHAMQYIIIWAGNIPDEVIWYAVRSERGWAIALWVLFLGQFIVPFFALLSARVRASTRALISVAAVTLVLRYLESAVLILPPLDLAPVAFVLCLPAAIVVTGAVFLLDMGRGGAGPCSFRTKRYGARQRQPADAAAEERNGDYRGAGEHA